MNGDAPKPTVDEDASATEMLRNGMNPIQLSFIAGASPDAIAPH